MNNNNKIDQELEISIDLENFKYSGTKHDKDRKNDVPKFFGRAREKARLLDRLIQGKGQGGSFLVAGYRGVGKTRFVTEVLRNYRNKGSFFSKRNFIEVRVNLGNDGDLNSK